jgi:alpha-L-rhamnosidase
MKSFFLVSHLANFALALAAFAAESTAPAVTVNDLRCEYRHDPLGIDAAKPRLSWILDSGR